MAGGADVNRRIAMPGQVIRLQQADANRLAEHGAIPSRVILAEHLAGCFALEHASDAVLGLSERFEIALCGHGRYLLAVLRIAIRIPRT